MSARRYNKGKNRMELIPKFDKEQLANVYTRGAHKYSIYKDKEGNEILGSKIPFEERSNYELIDDASSNWRKGLSWTETIGSVERHIEAWKKGEDFDSELSTYHLANASWGLFTLLEYYKSHPELDDRNHWYKKPFKRLFLDLDGVLCDFEQYFLKYFDLPNYHPHDWADDRFTTRLEELKDNDEFWLNAPVLTKPEDISYPITGYCTARSVKPEVILKWLSVNKFPKAQLLQVDFGESKVEKLKKAKCDIMLDDSIHNFVELNSNGVVCYLMTRSHNEKYNAGYLRVKDFKDFLTKI